MSALFQTPWTSELGDFPAVPYQICSESEIYALSLKKGDSHPFYEGGRHALNFVTLSHVPIGSNIH